MACLLFLAFTRHCLLFPSPIRLGFFARARNEGGPDFLEEGFFFPILLDKRYLTGTFYCGLILTDSFYELRDMLIDEDLQELDEWESTTVVAEELEDTDETKADDQ